MGIFDDAIRQHLDLKRRQGADESELKQLEDEAFGLPARPGDPDFPDTGEGEAAPSAEPESETTAMPDTPAEEAFAEPAPQPESKTEGGDMEALVEKEDAEPAPADDAPPHGDALLSDSEEEPEPTPPPSDAPVEDEGAGSFSTAEREAIADQPTEFFDQAPAELELGELDLDLEEEVEEVGALEEQPLTEEQLVEEAAAVDEAPADEAIVAEPDVAEPEPAPEPAEPSESSAEEAQPEGEPAEGEDVLEETPEFLRDNPDDDELWFEQGKPKDFDF